MFDKEYSFKGIHALRVEMLTANLDENVKGGLRLFARNFDVYMDAPLVGFLFNRKAEIDNTRNPNTNEVYTTKIFGDILIQNKLDLEFNYRLIMLLDDKAEKDANLRISKAFRRMGENYQDTQLYESYVRGGVDVLYEILIDGAREPRDYIEKLSEFVNDFQDRFNEKINIDEVMKLCRGND